MAALYHVDSLQPELEQLKEIGLRYSSSKEPGSVNDILFPADQKSFLGEICAYSEATARDNHHRDISSYIQAPCNPFDTADLVKRLEAARITILTLESKIKELVAVPKCEIPLQIETNALSQTPNLPPPLPSSWPTNPQVLKNEPDLIRNRYQRSMALHEYRPATANCRYILPSTKADQPIHTAYLSHLEHLKREPRSLRAPICHIRPSTAAADHQATRAPVTMSSHSVGSVDITELDSFGRFIRISNNSRTEADVSRWFIKQTRSGVTVTNYKFPNHIRILPFSTLTIWSSSDAPPITDQQSIVAKTISSFLPDMSTTILCNKSNQAAAWLTR